MQGKMPGFSRLLMDEITGFDNKSVLILADFMADFLISREVLRDFIYVITQGCASTLD